MSIVRICNRRSLFANSTPIFCSSVAVNYVGFSAAGEVSRLWTSHHSSLREWSGSARRAVATDRRQGPVPGAALDGSLDDSSILQNPTKARDPQSVRTHRSISPESLRSAPTARMTASSPGSYIAAIAKLKVKKQKGLVGPDVCRTCTTIPIGTRRSTRSSKSSIRPREKRTTSSTCRSPAGNRSSQGPNR
jgi:hypothetical protein